MVDTKLQDLIETLKKHGVESGEAASRQIVEEAEKKAQSKSPLSGPTKRRKASSRKPRKKRTGS